VSQTPLAHADSLRIGTVDFVSPDEVKVLLDIEAPESVALNAGGVRPFPRVNGYVLIPVDDGYLVGQIEWLTIERSAFPKRRGVQDFGLIDLPYPLRKMSLNPLGTLRKQPGKSQNYGFRRGADALPSVGSAVHLPTESQLRSIVESGERRRVRIGASPLAGNAEVKVDPDRLFGRHLAVLGNTGSGKSCTVAGLIRWSLEEARGKRPDRSQPNARFIVLDPNGEYARAFRKEETGLEARVYAVSAESPDLALRVPLWFWNSAEWAAFTQASAKAQKPALVQALRHVRDGIEPLSESKNHDLRRFLRTVLTTLRIERNSGSPWGSFPKPKSFWEKLEKWKSGLVSDLSTATGDDSLKLQALDDALESLCAPRRVKHATYDFERAEIENLIQVVREAHAQFGGSDNDLQGADVDAPLPFQGSFLVRSLEATSEMMGVSEYTETLLIRIRTLLADVRMKSIFGEPEDVSLAGWLESYVGDNSQDSPRIAIIDLSLVPPEVVHTITAVASRMIFEALQRYRKLNGKVLPTVLVMEEAHTFVRRYNDDIENPDAATICCQVFERIAREGRKFGLGLVLSSQRPSELSPTVLSQCNTFLLHRISNDRDQELVKRLVPDNLRGLLRELPSLPSQHAILLGWASELPVLLKVDELPEAHRPHSNDPDFWDVWTGRDQDGQAVTRDVDWGRIAEDWQFPGGKDKAAKSSPPAARRRRRSEAGGQE